MRKLPVSDLPKDWHLGFRGFCVLRMGPGFALRETERTKSSSGAPRMNLYPGAFAALPALCMAVLLTCATAAGQEGPPRDPRAVRASDLVELIRIDPRLKLDIRYATPDNFAGQPVYSEARAFLQRPAAEALVRVHDKLRKQGYSLLIYDGYRPWSVTKHFWDITPPEKRNFVADPKDGSRHNRGAAVDLTLLDLKTGKPVQMPSEFDEFTERSAITYQGGSAESRRLRDLLRSAMESEGFLPYPDEWWHYDFQGWKEYPILNIPFSAIGKQQTGKAQTVGRKRSGYEGRANP